MDCRLKQTSNISALKNVQILTHQKQLATCWTVRGSNSVGSKKFSILHSRADRSWDPLNFRYKRYPVSFLALQVHVHGDNHPHRSIVEIQTS